VGFERVERFAIAEKRRHRNEKVVQQRLRLIRILAQKAIVGPHVIASGDLHAPREPSYDGRAFVFGEIVPGPNAHMGEDPAQQFLVEIFPLDNRDAIPVADEFRQALGELAHRQDEIGNAGYDCGIDG
jgi:hypothetical protein